LFQTCEDLKFDQFVAPQREATKGNLKILNLPNGKRVPSREVTYGKRKIHIDAKIPCSGLMFTSQEGSLNIKKYVNMFPNKILYKWHMFSDKKTHSKFVRPIPKFVRGAKLRHLRSKGKKSSHALQMPLCLLSAGWKKIYL